MPANNKQVTSSPASLRLVLGDQLTHQLPSLTDIDPGRDVVLMFEVQAETTYVPHHKQKLVFILSAMRHFADELSQKGIQVEYTKLDDADNQRSLTGELLRKIRQLDCKNVIVTEPGEWRVLEMMHAWPQQLDISLEIRSDTRFLCSIETFRDWAERQNVLRMENFYRLMRKQTGWLMQDGKPVGGKWNFDAANRKAIPKNIQIPKRTLRKPDAVTREVMTLVERQFPDNPGTLPSFNWAVTREEASENLQGFLSKFFAYFGQFQDALKTGEDFLFHALISPYLNVGLLTPKEVCESALEYSHQHAIPIESTEGFLRQILGWREYVRGIYWLKAPEYAASNFFLADKALPEIFWTGDTPLFCLKQSIQATLNNAYAHHIQRLMVIGNFALLTGLKPEAVEAWYLAVYVDAFEWVELPNTHGMVLYADGGLLASKPYAASGAYINRMSDYCKHCQYDVNQKNGESACPFNYLYWDFLHRNQKRLANNHRLAMPYRNLSKMSDEKIKQIKTDAKRFIDDLV